MARLALLSLSLVLFSFSPNNITLTQAQCLPDQRQALIQLKQGFKTTELNSWNASTDCCKWDGVTCDEPTGRVTALNLTGRSISGKLNPSLFNLSSLQNLDLSGNYFYNITLPQTGFERLGNLTHLNLAYSGFAGQVPIGFSALTNLISLDLSDISSTKFSAPYPINNMYLHNTGLTILLRNHTKLQFLGLNGVDISLNGSEWGKAVFQVGPTLQELYMKDCRLRGNLPDEIFQFTNLTGLYMSWNSMLSGQLPEFTRKSSLQYLDLVNTNLTGPLPDSIGNLQYLSKLLLSNCRFYGEIPSSISNLTRLEYLSMWSNTLTGMIPMSLFSHPSLKYLDISQNQLSGFLPEFSNGSSILIEIELDNNNLQGQLPISIFKSPQLVLLSLSSNKFNGTMNLDTIKLNKKLESLDVSNNQLSIIEGKNHKESFYASFPQMTDIALACCNLTKFPSFIHNQTNIVFLDLSNNKMDGVIPNWLCSKANISYLDLSHNFFTNIEGDVHFTSLNSLTYLDISSNRISGPVPLLPQGINYVDFSSNRLTGEIPLSICNATSLQVFDLSYNNSTGTIPSCLLEDAEVREVLNLKGNKLSGPMPQNISQGCKFRTIILSGNRINGRLPLSLMNCHTLEVLDLGNNQIVDRFPFWLGNLTNLRVLVLRSNQFYGTISNMEAKTITNNSIFPTLKVFDLSSNLLGGIIPKIVLENLKAMVTNSDSSTFHFGASNSFGHYYQNSITIIWKEQEMEIKNSLAIFSSLDLSQNQFSGEIPEEIGQLKSLDGLNLSHNALTGSIPLELSKLQQLQSLDLSCNKLSGRIPQELTSLHFLSSLNLSYNNIIGEIPQVPQFSTFLNASYMGNPGLCGNPLSMQCATTPSNNGSNKGLPSKASTNIIVLFVSIGLGLGLGFASVIWILLSWENGREWFNFIIDRFYFGHIPWIVLHLRLAIGRE